MGSLFFGESTLGNLFKKKRHSERMRCNGIYITVIYIYMETNISQLWKRIFSSSQLPFFKGDMDSFPGHVAPKSSRSSHQRSFRSKEVKSYNSPTCNTARLLPFCLRKANRFPKPSCQNPKKKGPCFFWGSQGSWTIQTDSKIFLSNHGSGKSSCKEMHFLLKPFHVPL